MEKEIKIISLPVWFVKKSGFMYYAALTPTGIEARKGKDRVIYKGKVEKETEKALLFRPFLGIPPRDKLCPEAFWIPKSITKFLEKEPEEWVEIDEK